MARLEELTRGAAVAGVLPSGPVSVVDVKWHGSHVIELTYRDTSGRLGSELLYRDSEPDLIVVDAGKPWSFDGDGALLRLASEAQRISLAYLFDPHLAVHTSDVDPLPHQITAVYEEMLPRQPLRFLLADDPGAGKTIMAGLFIKELLVRGDLHRCLIVCPGSLVDQWQDELDRRFGLPFRIITRETIEASRTGNPFLEDNLVIARLDHLSRNEEVQAKLELTDWDLIVCDEAHKMAASYFGDEVKKTKRYQLGERLGGLCRHFLLMTATPHNGKEADFRLFMALLDADRFEGAWRDSTRQVETASLMRRLVKEQLLTFEGTPLFPERRAYTVTYKLSDAEAQLYAAVTNYVREEMNRADRLAAAGQGRHGAIVGFALTALQRRLASSPEAIYQSLRRRRERLQRRLREEQLLKRGAETCLNLTIGLIDLSEEELADLDEERPAREAEGAVDQVVDQASAAQTIAELRTEMRLLRQLEEAALRVRESEADRKWEELSRLLQGEAQLFARDGQRRKLIIFTEHRDTLYYLRDRITTLLGRPEAVVTIHGNMGREERRKVQEAFNVDPDVRILLATDAAGEGLNFQVAHLMVNYDLPWNPNRIEQRFGRIHRIGQTEVCHLWNLVAEETREGDVFKQLFVKLELAREALGGQVFDVLGKVFGERPLRELLIEAIRYGDHADIKARLHAQVDQAMDRQRLLDLIEQRALAHASMDIARVGRVREEMERAQARRLQPHFVEAFFLTAFRQLGGTIREREPRRYEITHVPALIRARDRQIGSGDHIMTRYERVTFEKKLIHPQGRPRAVFVCPGHPLLDVTIDLILERHRTLLRQGAILIDPTDAGEASRVLVYLEHEVRDGIRTKTGEQRVISKRLQFVEIDAAGHIRDAGPAPYLDYRPVEAHEQNMVEALRASVLDVSSPSTALEQLAQTYAAEHLVPTHLAEVRARKLALIVRTRAAVQDRLTKEIHYWDHRSRELREKERAGKGPRPGQRLNAELAGRRADELADRMRIRLAELDEEETIKATPTHVVGAALILPAGLLRAAEAGAANGHLSAPDPTERTRIERLAIDAILAAERRLGHEPRELAQTHPGYDIESRTGDGRLRFLEVKGKRAGQATVTVSKTQILTALNSPDQFILALVTVDGTAAEPRYVRAPFRREPDFGAASVTYDLAALLARSEAPG